MIHKQDLSADEVRQHLRCGKTVTQLGLIWDESIRFILTEQMTFKRLQFLDMTQERAEDDDPNTAALTAQWTMMETIVPMLNELAELLGGWIAA